jgi:DNA-binding response OmpR family regulator
LLDDEEGVRCLLTDTLEAAGYQVLGCDSGKSGIETLQGHPVDLLITDLVMEGQEGIETIRLARKEFPKLKIMAISGYGAGRYLQMARMLGADETLSKPLDLAGMCEKVRSLIGE